MLVYIIIPNFYRQMTILSIFLLTYILEKNYIFIITIRTTRDNCSLLFFKIRPTDQTFPCHVNHPKPYFR